ncbi:MAG: hypothetical protein ABIS34_01760 [Opitutus sp.]
MRYEGNRYADQKYLDAWETAFQGVTSIQNPGANVAPWNVKGRAVESLVRNSPTIDGTPLIFFHFHALAHVGEGLYDTGLYKYDATVSAGLREFIYDPYLKALDRTGCDNAPESVLLPMRTNNPQALLAGNFYLERLRVAENDRAERLLSIEVMQAQLDVHGQRRQLAEAQVNHLLESAEGTRKYLETVEADRSARLTLIQSLQRDVAARAQALQAADAQASLLAQELSGTKTYLATVEGDRAARLDVIRAMQSSQETQGRELQTARAEAQLLKERLAGTQIYLEEVEQDRANRLRVIEQFQAQLETTGLAAHTAEARVRELEESLAGCHAYLAQVEADRAARLAVIKTLQSALDASDGSKAGARATPADSLKTVDCADITQPPN